MSRIRKLEEITLNSWPAAYSRLRDGWIMRYAGGYTNRSNSVYPLYDSHESLSHKIEEVRSFYRSRDLPPMFKLTQESKPVFLDNTLEEMGFQEIDRALVMTKTLDSKRLDISDLDIFPTPEERWLDIFFSLNKRARGNKSWAKKLLSMVISESFFVLLKKEGNDVGCGLAVIEGDHIGLFGIAVLETERRKGYGIQITEKLLELGKKRGARIAYLQVDKPNINAIRLYSRVGFKMEYEYWYRVDK